MLENDKDDENYDYVYRWAILNNKSHVLILILSNHISPALLIKLSENLEETNENEENIYEEIIPQNRKIGRSNIKQLQMNRFAGWNLDCQLMMRDSVKKVGGQEY